ncbi:6-phosphogluconolactonase [Crocosphaera chwakensis]|uniref:6-phosphogluconolactonase n=1 Tax=Crocosphaera chwakensis CCY0110 TaxID=391612 RepID=A3IWX0_9CHRO|nr:6-phosphogluconolactonase [Crocosphaera chwakensis]EAZ89021.1 6-phosphogluconolactonase [Crocosphaera chwakensis CCY0110]
MTHIQVLSDKPTLIAHALDLIVDKIHTTLQQQDQDKFTLALAGGSTPKPLYEALAKQSLPLEKIHIFWGDERYVAADHADSNQLMARQAWLEQVDFPPSNIHVMPTSGNDPSLDAQTHDQELREFFEVKPGEFPTFDIILLGMGDDGHTASLFPQTEALTVSDRLVTVGNKDGTPRLTFTYPLINHARCVIFLVAGENKRPALAQIFSPDGDPTLYPAKAVQPQGELIWLLDEAAGGELNT